MIRSRRRKCDTPHFGAPCIYCSERGIQCTRDSSFTLHISKSGPGSLEPSVLKPRSISFQTTASSSNGFPPLSICIELVNLYFDFIHDQFHSLFHRPRMIEDVEEGRAPPVILLAMMGLSARSSLHLSVPSLSDHISGSRTIRSFQMVYHGKGATLLQRKAVASSILEMCL